MHQTQLIGLRFHRVSEREEVEESSRKVSHKKNKVADFFLKLVGAWENVRVNKLNQ